ncbi:restriction endonuclease subunit S [bacterium]|nr:restriction endonuclease subunit S [bacterium]
MIGYRKISEVCTVTTGEKDVNEGANDGLYPFFTCAALPLRSNSYSFDGDAILLPGNGANVGLVMFYHGKFEAYQRTYVLHNFKEHAPYIFYFLKGLWKFSVIWKQYGSATNYIRLHNITDFKIPLPPLPIQKRIAAILEKADAAREKRRQTIELTDKFLQSAFLEMFGDPVTNPKGWDVNTFNKIADIEKDGILPLNIPKDSFYVGLEHIEKESGRLIGYQNAFDADLKSNKFIFTSEHILYGKLRPYLNKVCIPNISGICSTDIIPIMPIKGKSNKFFLAYHMKHKSFVDKATSLSAGANLPRISPKILETFNVYFPPLFLQQKFAALVEKVEAMRTKQRASEQELENLFQSLMQRAFKGELVS